MSELFICEAFLAYLAENQRLSRPSRQTLHHLCHSGGWSRHHREAVYSQWLCAASSRCQVLADEWFESTDDEQMTYVLSGERACRRCLARQHRVAVSMTDASLVSMLLLPASVFTVHISKRLNHRRRWRYHQLTNA